MRNVIDMVFNPVPGNEKQAEEFLKSTNTQFKAEFLKHGKHFDDEKEQPRDIYKVTLTRGNRSYTFNFGQSIVCSGQWIVHTREGKKLMHGTNSQMQKFRAKGLHVEKNKEFREPSPYDVLSCMTKYDPVSFEDFCGEYGYDTDSRRAEKAFNAVKNEWMNIQILFSDSEIEKIQEFV